MKKTLVNTLNKAGRIYRATHNGLMYVVANGCSFIFADTLDGLDTAKLNPEIWDSTAGNNAAQILKLVQDAIDYNEPALIPVYNLGTVTHSTGKMIIVEDESKEARAAFNEKICNFADSFGKNDLYLFTPDGEKPGPRSWLIGTLDGVINIALLPINFKNNAVDLADLAAEARENTKAATEAAEAKKAAQKAAKAAKKREKKPEPREIMTEKEAAGLLTGPDWTTNAAMLIGFDMRNSNLIMQAALDAGLLTPEMILAYLFYYKMPAFHTFNAWKDHGYIVKRGERAAFQAKIWKYAEKHGTMTAEEAASLNAIMTDADGGELFHAGDETTDSRYLMKTAYFFTADQVEKITRGQIDIPADCKRTTQDGREIISGNTRPIKEQLKAAGYSWDRKRAAWWRLAEAPQDPQQEATPAA